MRARRHAVWAVVLVTVGCAGGPGSSDAGVVTLAKLDGWAARADSADAPFAVLEVAVDEESARALWAESVAEPPAPARGPLDFGVYGDLADIDLSSHVLGLYSSGQSGSCPASLTEVRTAADGTVSLTTSTDGDVCTDDYNPYRVVVAIDRDDLPPLDALSTAPVVVDGNERLAGALRPYSQSGTP